MFNFKVEFFFPPSGDSRPSFYDISLVDGYSMPSEIVPVKDVSKGKTLDSFASAFTLIFFRAGQSMMVPASELIADCT